MNTIITQSAMIGRTPNEVELSLQQAKNSNFVSGILKNGIKFIKTINSLILL